MLLAHAAPCAAEVTGHGRQETVTQVLTYTESGVVYFITNDPATGCPDGYWLRPSDAGFKTAYAAVVMSYTTKAPARVWAYNDSLWAGSSGKICRLYAFNPV